MKEKDNKELEELTADMPKKKLPVWSKIVIGVVIALLAILGIVCTVEMNLIRIDRFQVFNSSILIKILFLCRQCNAV